MSRAVPLRQMTVALGRRITQAFLGATVLIALSSVAAAQGTVTGTVVAEDTGQPLQNVQLVVVGTNLGALSGADGSFVIDNVPTGSQEIEARRIGYRRATVSVVVQSATEARIDLSLAQSAIELDQVVVTGTPGGTQRRAIGNAVATVNAAEVLERSGATDVSSLINGRAPGVIMTPGTGRVGSGPTISIRGRSTISLNQEPLIYIDGVRVNNDVATGPDIAGFGAISRLNDINPEDIESIEVIKGPAAATLYGTEAANGVIQIITKRGAGGGAPQFNATVRQGTSWFPNAEERVRTNYAIHPATGELLSFNAVRYEAERGRDLFDTGHLQGYNLGVRGGTESIRYYVSSAYDDQTSVEPGNSLRRFMGHMNLAVAATERLDIESSLNLVKGRTYLGGGTQSSILLNSIAGNPLFEAFGLPAGPYLSYTPQVFREVFQTSQDLARFTGSVGLNHRPIDWFEQRLTVGLDQTGEDNQYLRRYAPPHLENQFASAAAARGGIQQWVRNSAFVTADYSGTVTLPINDALSSASSVGLQYYRRRTDTNNITADEFPAPGLTTAAAAARVTGTQDYLTNSTLGVYAQQQFGWQNRLFLTGALRVDNNSAFGEDISFVTYPKISGAWVISEEDFWPTGPVDQFRLRGAYGASGQQPDAFAALRTYGPATGTGDLPVVVPQSLGNPELRPERGEELELGFDAGFMGRFGLEFTYYDRRVRDAILARSIAPSSGFSGTQFVNIGEVHNRGMEVQLDAQVVSTPTVAWDVGVSFATSRDEITDLGGISFIQLLLPTQRHVEGYPIGSVWSREIVSADLNEAGQAINILCDDGAGGSIACSEAPLIYFGTPTPTRHGSFSTTISLGNRLRLHGMANYQGGHTLFNTNDFIRCTLLRVCEENVNPDVGDPTLIAATQIGGDFSAVSPFLEDGSYVRLREVSATYTLPEAWGQRVGASRASFTLSGRNLHTWTGYTGLDPESRAHMTPSLSVVSNDQGVLPVMPEIVGSLRLTF